MYDKNKMKDLEKMLGEVLNETSKDRIIKGYRGCITEGMKDLDDPTHCRNKECTSCNMFLEAMKQAFEDFKDEE